MDPDLNQEDRETLRRLGIKPGVTKPGAVWCSQIVFGAYSAVLILGALRGLLDGNFASLVQLALGGGFGYLTIALQRRKRWAFLASSAVLAMTCIAAIARQLMPESSGPLPIAPGERTGAAVGGVLVCLLLIALAIRFTFGEPTRKHLKIVKDNAN